MLIYIGLNKYEYVKIKFSHSFLLYLKWLLENFKLHMRPALYVSCTALYQKLHYKTAFQTEPKHCIVYMFFFFFAYCRLPLRVHIMIMTWALDWDKLNFNPSSLLVACIPAS